MYMAFVNRVYMYIESVINLQGRLPVQICWKTLTVLKFGTYCQIM